MTERKLSTSCLIQMGELPAFTYPSLFKIPSIHLFIFESPSSPLDLLIFDFHRDLYY